MVTIHKEDSEDTGLNLLGGLKLSDYQLDCSGIGGIIDRVF